MAKRNTLSTTAKNTTAAVEPAEVTVAEAVPTAMSSTLSKPAASAPPADAPADSKQSRLVTLLRRTEGATIAELMAATGWMSHSVRGALSAVVKRKLGLTVESGLETDRGRVYRVASPPVTKPATGRRKAKPAPEPAAWPASPSLQPGRRSEPDEVAAALAGLPELSIAELRAEWRRLYRSQPPAKLRRDTLELVVAWQLQARVLGGLPAADQRRLVEVADQVTTGSMPKRARRVSLRSGARLVRAWGGETHEVQVIDGVFVWRDRRWTSLSAIARAITGARWSGPRFFGIGGPSPTKRGKATGEGADAAR